MENKTDLIKDKVKKTVKKESFVFVLLAIVILLQLLNITNIIIERKKGHHSDEVFSYGLANSFYEPFLETDGLRSSIGENHEHNLNQWISADVLRNYVTVQKGEQFRYDSVWYNQTQDRHPPFYYAVMHTICSFFPDTFSWWFGYGINFVCLAVMQIFLYKLSRNILKSKYLALLVCVFWGFSTGAIDLTIFVRMYCMLAMWTVIFLYLHSKLLETDSKPLLKQLIPIMVVTVCGALTQYLFLFVAFITAVCFCIRYLYRKQWKIFWAYGFSVLGATAAAMLIFPQYLSLMFMETDHQQTEFFRQFRLCIRYILDAVFPISQSTLIFWIPTLSAVLIVLAIMSIPVFYLFRDKKPVIQFLGKLKEKILSVRNFDGKKMLSRIIGRCKRIHILSVIMILFVICIMALTAYTIVFSAMFYVNRYLFILYPIAALLIACLIDFFFSWFRYKKQLLAVILIFVTIVRLPAKGLQYLFEYSQDIESIQNITDNAECIVTASELGEIWMMDYLPAEMYHADRIFMTCIAEQEYLQDELESIHTDKPIYLFLQNPDYITLEEEGYYIMQTYDENHELIEHYVTEKEYQEKYIAFYQDLSIAKQFEYMGIHVMFSREYSVYRLA